MKEKILSVQNLSIHFASQLPVVKAVDHISFDLGKGESLGIVGESGSGKTITALSILNLLPPASTINSGKIEFFRKHDSVDLTGLNDKSMRAIRGNEIAMIFQEPMSALNPAFTCGNQVVENILEHQKLKPSEARELCLHLFEQVKLPEPSRIFKSYPHQLSGGQQQRVMIAMAVSCNPKILIADEPTTALDVTVQKSILNLLKELTQKYNMSLIFISHDLGVVSEIADTIAVMNNGKIVELNSKKPIITNPGNAYTKGLLACRPPVSYKPERLKTLQDFSQDSSITTSRREKKYKKKFEDVLFSLENVSKSFPVKTNFLGKPKKTVEAIKNVSLRIHKHETLGLVGESGCGKSTLGRLMLKFLYTTNGDIYYQGNNLKSLNRRKLKNFRQEAQIIFQDPYSSLNPKPTVEKIISEPINYYHYTNSKKETQLKVKELLNDVRLGEDFLRRYPHELSGGQRQRVAIARVLALQPSFIVCDESVSALDVSIQAEVLNLLQDLKEKYELTYVFISHDFSVVRFMADTIAVMKEGEIIEKGASDNIFEAPKNQYTKMLLNSIPNIEV